MTNEELNQYMNSIRFILKLQEININTIEEKLDKLEQKYIKEKNNENRKRNRRRI